MRCSQTFSSVTTNGIDVFLLENPDFFPFLSYNIFSGRFPAKFIHSPIDFQTNGLAHVKTLDHSVACFQEQVNIPHINFFDFDLHDQVLIGINFMVFLILSGLWCTVFYAIGMCIEKFVRFLFQIFKKLFLT
ncbi:MAG: hypothetical protein ACTTH6_01205 [Candidatus Altimarinota bacterium]